MKSKQETQSSGGKAGSGTMGGTDVKLPPRLLSESVRPGEQTSSPTASPIVRIHGYFDVCEPTGIVGWLVDREARDRPLDVEVIADGHPVVRTAADVFRPDLAKAGIGKGWHGYRIKLPDALFDGKEHVIEVREVATGSVLKGSPRKFKAAPVPPPECSPQVRIQGYFDTLEAARVSGWLVDLDARDRPLDVEVLADGHPVVRAAADFLRPDLVTAGIGKGKHGYRIKLPDALFDGNEHVIEVREAATGFVLQGSPKIFKELSASGRDAEERAKLVTWKEKSEHLSEHDLARIASQIEAWPMRPVFSVIMPVFNPPVRFLREAIDSVLGQLYTHWELCIADDASTNPEVREVLGEYQKRDPRIQVVYRSHNGHICAASNTALKMAKGDYIALLDHDDRLPPHALYCYAGEIIRDPELRWLYSDMEIIDENSQLVRLSLRQPPDKEYFRSRNYMGAHAVYRRDLVASLGGFRKGYEGSQDYDLGLRALEALPLDAICHVPLLLYQWRRFEGSASNGILTTKPYAVSATQRSLADHLARNGINGLIKPTRSLNYFEVRYLVAEPAPLVSIIIPTRDRVDLLRPCVHSLVGHTAYAAYEIVVADNESADPEARTFLRHIEEAGIARVLSCPGEFNYSTIVNKAVAAARGDIICILNNDTEVIHEEWLSILVGIALQPDVGVVGPMLLYDNYTIQHGGVVFDDKYLPRHCFKDVSATRPGKNGLVAFPRAVPAVTGACQVMRKEIFHEVGGMDERHYKVAYGDIDFCLKARETGYRNVYTPFARMFHWESASRGILSDHGAEYALERRRELSYLQHNWITRVQMIDAGNPHEDTNGDLAPSPRWTVRQAIGRYDHLVRPHLAFLHIPKTAGCSFREWVQSHLSVSGVAILDGATNLGCYDGSHTHIQRVREVLRRAQAVYSHFTYGLHERIGVPLWYVTLLRDPVKRVWSEWNYLLQTPTSPFFGIGEDDIEPFIRKNIISGNLMTRMLAGERPEPVSLDEIEQGPCWHSLGHVGFHFSASLWRGGVETALRMPDAGPDNDAELLERAMRNLERFFFIGRVEALDQAAEALAASLNWEPGHPIPHINKGKGNTCRDNPRGQKNELIEEYNQLDIRLYRFIAEQADGYLLNDANRMDDQLRCSCRTSASRRL